MKVTYSGTPPYDHPVYKTTSLLRPYSFKPKVKNIDSFYYFEDPVNATTSLLRPGFYGPTVVVLTGFHCRCLPSCLGADDGIKPTLKNLSNNDGDDYENVTQNGNLSFFKHYRAYSISFNSSNVANFFLELNSERLYGSSGKEK